MSYYGSFVLQCYMLRMRVMTSTVGGNLTNRPRVLRHIHVKLEVVINIDYQPTSAQNKIQFMTNIFLLHVPASECHLLGVFQIKKYTAPPATTHFTHFIWTRSLRTRKDRDKHLYEHVI